MHELRHLKLTPRWSPGAATTASSRFAFVQVLPALQHSAVAACFRCYPPARVRRPGLHSTGQVRAMAGVVAEEKEIPQTEQVVRSLEPAGAVV